MYSLYLNEPVNGVPASLQVVYTGHDDADLKVGIRELVESYNRRLPPSRILFVCPSGIERQIQDSLTRKDTQLRLKSPSHVTVAPYDSHGTVISDRIVNIKASDWDISDGYVHRLAQSAVEKIVNATKTILYAPHGYRFRKPSGREEDIFVRAGNMLREPGSLSVFNFLLLRKLPCNCRFLYVDSFTILSFALGLKSIIRYFQESNPTLILPVIENIHSYEISGEFRIPNEPNYFVVISASTSGGFARKLVEEKQARPERIVHLLGVANEESQLQEKCIYFRVSEPRGAGNAGGQKAIIDISTEEFIVAQGLPRSVRITRRLVNQRGKSELCNSFYFNAMTFYGPNTGTGYSPFSLADDPTSYTSSPIRAWIRKALVHELPASTRVLIHLDDPMSTHVAESIEQSLGHDVKVYSLAEFLNLQPGRVDGATVVVAYQDPGLVNLRRANVKLRDWNDAHQHYLVCYAFPTSAREHKRLKDDLRMGPGGKQFGWSEFLVLPVGLHDAPLKLDLERYSLTPYADALGEKLVAALVARFGSSSTSSDGLFLPRIDGSSLELRRGSIFFGEQTGEVGDLDVSQICVYAMVAAAMQKAREAEVGCGGAGWSGFDDNPFVRSVLDPSMFVRFNDGILQASLLRASRPCELDYSASDDFSRQFTAACRSVLVNCTHDVGEAALEFIHALVTEKVALRQEDRRRLDEEIERNPVLKSVSELLKAERDEVGLA